jgi:hypothetical protein
MADPHRFRTVVGAHGAYEWLVTQHYLEDVLKLCPEVVVEKCVAVVSCDSGPLRLNDDEISSGWNSRNDIAYSPVIRNVEVLPQVGFDEWYIFDKDVDLGTLDPQKTNVFDASLAEGHVHSFVNFGGFRLDSQEWESITNFFWKQFAWIQPHSYVAEGTSLTIVSADRRLFTAVRSALSELGGDPKCEWLL